jgi:hypothetical protein
MGYDAENADPFSLYTSKQTAAIDDAIWIIAGSGKRPRQYTLRGWFIVSEITPADHPEFGFRLIGAKGGSLEPAPILNGLPWFNELFDQMAHFSLGLTQIKEVETVKRFKKLAKAAGRPMA